MEATGLILGILPIFKLCLEHFQLYKTAQAASIESQILLLKLDCEHESFIIWGEKNGVFLDKGDPGRNPDLDRPDKLASVTKSLQLINSLLSDAKALQGRYGVSITTVSNTTDEPSVPEELFPSTSGLKRLKRLIGGSTQDAQTLSVLRKTRWAISDKTKFQSLVADLHSLVENLYRFLPVPASEQNALAIKDIRTLSGYIGRLRLFEEASQDIYPAWSGAASVMREASSTRNAPGTISQWMLEVEDDSDPEEEQSKKKIQKLSQKESDGKDHEFNFEKLTYHNGYRTAPFFVFTSDCLSLFQGLSCDAENLEVSEKGPSFVFYNDSQRTWGLGNRISKTINPKVNTDELEFIKNSNYEVQEELRTAVRDIIENMYPAETVYIYCPPCRCALRTALIICDDQDKRIISYIVRIDERIPCTCCPRKDKLHRLRSILKTAYEWDQGLVPSSFPLNALKFIDRVSLEARIYDLETQLYEGDHLGDVRQQIVPLLVDMFNSYKKRVVFMGEASQCSWIVQTKPFPWSPRVPKANEIFQYTSSNSGINLKITSKYLGTFTTVSPSFPVAGTSKKKVKKSPRSTTSSQGRPETGKLGSEATESGHNMYSMEILSESGERTGNDDGLRSQQGGEEAGEDGSEDSRSAKRMKL